MVDVSDLWHSSLSTEEVRSFILNRLENLGITDNDFIGIINNLRNSDELEEFDYHWSRLYDWGDKSKRLFIYLYHEGIPV